MTTIPPFPEVLDSSIMSGWRSCRHKFFLEYLHHWKPRTPNVHLHAGAAYAKGLEVARVAFYQNGLSEEDAYALGLAALLESYGDFECPLDSAKSLERTAGAFEYYTEKYPFPTDHATPIILPSGKRAIEFSFAEPLDILHPVTGNPIIYCGRFDMMVDYAGGKYGLDDKTTSQLGASWPKQWDLRSQFTGYCWGAGRAGIHLNGFLVRGVSILKTKYDTLEAITYRHPWMIEEWYEGLLMDIQEMMFNWEEASTDITSSGAPPFRKNLDNSCNEYGGCIFKQICMSKEPEPWLAANFERRQWNPLTRGEIILPGAP